MEKDATRGPPETSKTAAGRDTRPRRRPDTGRNIEPGPRRVQATGTTIAGRGGVPARAFRAITVRSHQGRRDCEPGRLLYIEQSRYTMHVRPHVTRAKIRAPSPVLAVVLLAILVMASAVLGWLGGLVAWLIVLGALAVFAFCLRGRP